MEQIFGIFVSKNSERLLYKTSVDAYHASLILFFHVIRKGQFRVRDLFIIPLGIIFLGVTLSLTWAEEVVVGGDEVAIGDNIDEIVVTGVKESLKKSIEIKRANTGVMEAISQEDFGKFPDVSLTEALARVAGIAVDERDGQEGQEIAARGFAGEFNLVTLNGRQMPTIHETGRSFNFGDIASSGVSLVEVYKSSNSALPGGGIGATINMVTTKPMQVEGTKKYASIAFVENTTSVNDSNPVEAEFLFSTNQDWWGLSLSAAYQRNFYREESTQETNWIVPGRQDVIDRDSNCCRVQNVSYDEVVTSPGVYEINRIDVTGYTNNNIRSDGWTFYQEPSGYFFRDSERTRRNLQVAFEMLVNDYITTRIDYTMSSVDDKSEGVMFGSWLGGWDTSEALINEDGVFTDVTVGNRSYDHSLMDAAGNGDNESVGLNILWEISDAWSMEFDAHNSSARRVGNNQDNYPFSNILSVTSNTNGNLTFVNGGGSGIGTFSYDRNFTPENYLASGYSSNLQEKEDEIDQVQIKGTWVNPSDSMISSVEFGISLVDNNFDYKTSSLTRTANSPRASDFPDEFFTVTPLGDFMGAFDADLGTDYYISVDREAVLGVLDTIIDNEITGVPSHERVAESVDALFFQANIDTEVMERRLRVSAGLRYERSDRTSVSLNGTPTVLRWDMVTGIQPTGVGGLIDEPRESSAAVLLPSVAVALNVTEQQIFRLSYSKSIARPAIGELRAGYDYGNVDYFTPRAWGGNPDLEELESKNLDLAYEIYYGEGSYIAVNYFAKEISGFPSGSYGFEDLHGLPNPAAGDIGQFARSCVADWAEAGRPTTTEGTATEVQYCPAWQATQDQPWMTDFQHMGWVALAAYSHLDLPAEGKSFDGYLPPLWNVWSAINTGETVPNCDYSGYWRCEPGYYDGRAGDPLGLFYVERPYNLETGTVKGLELTAQHLFEGTPFGININYTFITGGDVDVDRYDISTSPPQFLLPGFGDSGNFSVFYEDEKHTARLSVNYRGETLAGFGDYDQPLFINSRHQVDATYNYRLSNGGSIYVDALNITDETVRLFARHDEMLFLAQDHGPIYKVGFRKDF